MTPRLSRLAALAVIACLAGCAGMLMTPGGGRGTPPPAGSASAGAATVSGSVVLRDSATLPGGAEIVVRLEDISRADAAAKLLGQTRFRPAGGPPWPFAVRYDPARIEPRGRYRVAARITAGGRLTHVTDVVVPVITGGAPTSGVEVPVTAVR
jgi:putative lipoprotein